MIYGMTQSEDLFVLQNGKTKYFLDHETCSVKGVITFLPDPVHPGNLYLATKDSTICYGALEDHFANAVSTDVSPLTNINLFEYIDGQVWICSDTGIGNID